MRSYLPRSIFFAQLAYKKHAHHHHISRRMFITRALEKGIDVKVIAQWQGHIDGGKLILDTYSHVSTQHVKRMAQLMTE